MIIFLRNSLAIGIVLFSSVSNGIEPDEQELIDIHNEQMQRTSQINNAFIQTKEFDKTYHAIIVVKTERDIKNANAKIKEEKRIGAISGYVDKKIIYEAGKSIVSDTNLRNEAFSIYKKSGGRSKTPSDISKLISKCQAPTEWWGSMSILTSTGTEIFYVNAALPTDADRNKVLELSKCL